MAGAPLNDDEIEVIRRMIVSYLHDAARRKMLDEFWTGGRKAIITVAALLVWVLTVAAAVIQILNT